MAPPPVLSNKSSLNELIEVLHTSLASADQRCTAVNYLKAQPCPQVLEALLHAVCQKGDSVLVRHEVAYVVGQVGDASCLAVLTSVLEDTADDAIVRHECAEALGAIGLPASLDVLAKYALDEDVPEVSETCNLAIRRITWLLDEANQENSPTKSAFTSIDPAPPLNTSDMSTAELQALLLDNTQELFLRYRVMFALRDRVVMEQNHDENVGALCTGLLDEHSALFRHEVAFVLGQLGHPASVSALVACLATLDEHDMVRHEAAEALGSVAEFCGDKAALQALQDFSKDESRIVRESCEVALDAFAYFDGFEG